jgi:hypothetical protein
MIYGALVILIVAASVGLSIFQGKTPKAIAKEPVNYEFKCEPKSKDYPRISRCENAEVICYIRDDHGLSCEWKDNPND